MASKGCATTLYTKSSNFGYKIYIWIFVHLFAWLAQNSFLFRTVQNECSRQRALANASSAKRNAVTTGLIANRTISHACLLLTLPDDFCLTIARTTILAHTTKLSLRNTAPILRTAACRMKQNKRNRNVRSLRSNIQSYEQLTTQAERAYSCSPPDLSPRCNLSLQSILKFGNIAT